MLQLVARVKVGLRRRSSEPSRIVLTFGDVQLDLRARRVLKGGQEVQLTRKEFDLLVLLAKRAGEVIPRDEICDLLWGAEVFITQRVIDTHVASLRKKIESDPNSPRHIMSVRGVGYKLG